MVQISFTLATLLEIACCVPLFAPMLVGDARLVRITCCADESCGALEDAAMLASTAVVRALPFKKLRDLAIIRGDYFYGYGQREMPN